MTMDPVCLNEVDEREASMADLLAIRNGRTFFFCSEECKRRFERDPGMFMHNQEEWDESGQIGRDETSA